MSTQTHRSHTVASLDGLRGIAILAVLALHAGVPGMRMGGYGVDLFFALSGFLITTLLCEEWNRDGRIDLKAFWVRRCLRLMPVYWLFVTLVLCAMAIADVPFHPIRGWTSDLYRASIYGYFVNYAPVRGLWEHQEILGILWSLAVEEQFYFAWPFVFIAIASLRRPFLPAVALAVVVLMRRHFATDAQAFMFRIDTRGLAIVWGCATALWCWRQPRSRLERLAARRSLRAGTVLGIVGLAATATLLHYRAGWDVMRIHRALDMPMAVLFSALAAMLWYGPRDVWDRTLAWRPLAAIGVVSYGLYVYHRLVQWFVWDVATPGLLDGLPASVRYAVRLAVFFTLAFVVAWASYRCYERPFLALKRYFRSGVRQAAQPQGASA
jgi:peptidoglycan/LPS O-acetylase OafA/YrhL